MFRACLRLFNDSSISPQKKKKENHRPTKSFRIQNLDSLTNESRFLRNPCRNKLSATLTKKRKIYTVELRRVCATIAHDRDQPFYFPMNGMPMHEEILLFISDPSYPFPVWYRTLGAVTHPSMVNTFFNLPRSRLSASIHLSRGEEEKGPDAGIDGKKSERVILRVRLWLLCDLGRVVRR